ncbi:Clp protease N-terminal domain-containing protein [Mycobacterium sp. ITM-2016-00316]|uniref:Clp protease N-terminal domain-containing protein n=1 Tax=Mycobacterium sp. ITM-2016-00316 TaxID=2099695 RepID=UPI000CF86DF4|nr:Clp protease N-terminal domain-containing protein [Mycobacterium sp. ITM-2016-00316]WNG82804.1 Clp protease N-terminal domain-containing protein [Mycobacterium sp. ITM-2016-00316]
MFERFSRTARVAVVLAQEEARDLGSDDIGPEHLLIAVLQAAGSGLNALLAGYGLTATAVRSRLAANTLDDADSEALRTIGIDLKAVRDSVARSFGDDALDNALTRSGRRRRRHLPFTRAAKKTLELSLREAVAHKDTVIGCEHLLLGIIRCGDPRAAEVLGAHVGPAALHAEIVALLDAAA